MSKCNLNAHLWQKNVTFWESINRGWYWLLCLTCMPCKAFGGHVRNWMLDWMDQCSGPIGLLMLNLLNPLCLLTPLCVSAIPPQQWWDVGDFQLQNSQNLTYFFLRPLVINTRGLIPEPKQDNHKNRRWKQTGRRGRASKYSKLENETNQLWGYQIKAGEHNFANSPWQRVFHVWGLNRFSLSHFSNKAYSVQNLQSKFKMVLFCILFHLCSRAQIAQEDLKGTSLSLMCRNTFNNKAIKRVCIWSSQKSCSDDRCDSFLFFSVIYCILFFVKWLL